MGNDTNIDPEVLIRQLRGALPGHGGGHWEMVSFSFSAGAPKKTDDGKEKAGDEKKKGDDENGDEGTQDAPIKPGGPRIEAAYEWVESS